MGIASRTVLDTSKLIGAILKPQSIPSQALNLATEHAEILVSEETLAELACIDITPMMVVTIITMRIIVVLHTDDGQRFGVTVPDLPGCFSGGDSLDDALVLMPSSRHSVAR